jgi:cellulose synthase/poly-beta-1,6-N-acetylglucosamine synthase-like glycosyltransferase
VESDAPDGLQTDVQRLDHAVNRLQRHAPEFSADRLFTPGQRSAVAALLVALVILGVFAPGAMHTLALIGLVVPFSFVVVLRLAALWHWTRAMAKPAGGEETAPLVIDAGLWPRYSVLVPLYRETAAAAALLAGLDALDYPRDRLEIFLITEADDAATRAALLAAGLTPNMRIVTVPLGAPKTKPRALNYALTFAAGDMIAVFDAEDLPEPGQLKAAVRAFRAAGPELACVQARLDIYNPDMGFCTRQFTLEYGALFTAILPALARFGLPLPLGGTSNHFPRRILEEAGAWDPFNVTEDADLGMRLARLGLRTAMLSSATWEEAPGSSPQWFRQRTRWIKGWMQTYLVHMRDPSRLLGDLGPWGFSGFQMIFGGLILSALVHPLFYLGLASQAMSGGSGLAPPAGWPSLLWGLCAFNIAASYLAGMALAALAVAERGRWRLAVSALGLPFYWLMISAAAYAALYELIRRPHHWLKTDHIGAAGHLKAARG